MYQKNENIQKYKSCSTGEPCTAAQYIAELVCIRKREKDNTGNLEYKFWNKSQKDEYQIQIRVANKLINKYSIEAVLHYLNTAHGKKTYSLGFLHSSKKFVLISKYVEDYIKISFEITEAEKQKPKKVIDTESIDKLEYTTRPKNLKTTLLNKIRKAENG
jgi:hypothetical protein